MRQIVLDTETTGLEPAEGHRIIEIGALELVNRRATGKRFHYYLQPDRAIDAGAMNVHGITNEFLVDKPRFFDIAEEFIAFITGAELVIHNAAFDVGFLNHELRLWNETAPQITEYCQVLCTLTLARQLHPGQKNNLDALCKRYTVDNSQRQWHGALLDAEILTDVYLAMTGGQASLSLDASHDASGLVQTSVRRLSPERPALVITLPTSDELSAHRQHLEIVDKLSDGQCVWKKLGEGA